MLMACSARIVVVEDHAGMRAALADGLLDARERVEVIGTFASGEAFLDSPLRAVVDVALIDLGLPGASGCQVIRTLARETPTLRSIALTVFDDKESVFEALACGAQGFLLKDEPIERIVRAIGDVLCGHRPLSSGVTRFLIDQAFRFTTQIELTARERTVAQALADGLSYTECGERFGITRGTVQDYVKRIYRKVDVRSKRELKLWLDHKPNQPRTS